MSNRSWPLPRNKIRITSRFAGRTNPVTGRPENHSGTDFAAPDGTPFYAVADGTVQYIGKASGYGQWIVIDHPAEVGGGCSEYGHMWNAFQTGLKAGDRVKKGQLLGYVGSNGQSTGPHLHLTVYERGYRSRRVDPETWLAGADYPGEAPAKPWTPPVVPGTIFGIDISSWQKDYPLAKVKADGMEFVIIRLCDGTYQDPLFQSHLEDAEKQGLLVSTYWYLRAPSEGTSIAQQVDVIDKQMNGRRDLGVWIDVESVDKQGRALLTKDDVWAAKRELEARGYHVPGIYSGAWYWEVMPGGEPSMEGLGHLWVSNYGKNRKGDPRDTYLADGGANHRGWTYPLGDRKPDLLQFGSEGVVGDHYPVDVNAYRGTRDELARIFHPRNTKEEPMTTATPHPWPDGPAALNDTKNAAQASQTILTAPITSFIDESKSYEPRTMLALIDAATWRMNVLMEAICAKLGLDSDQIITDATKEAK